MSVPLFVKLEVLYSSDEKINGFSSDCIAVYSDSAISNKWLVELR